MPIALTVRQRDRARQLEDLTKKVVGVRRYPRKKIGIVFGLLFSAVYAQKTWHRFRAIFLRGMRANKIALISGYFSARYAGRNICIYFGLLFCAACAQTI